MQSEMSMMNITLETVDSKAHSLGNKIYMNCNMIEYIR